MLFGLYGVGLGAMATPDGARIASLAESLGYESLWTGEHMVLPSPQQPPSHRAPHHPFLDPIVALTYLAATTSTIRLGTGVLILPQRHPVQLAKELVSLDVLSRGRLMVGVGVGYLEAEFRALGADLESRGARTDEAIAAMRELWHSPKPTFSGRYVSFDGVEARPGPVRPTGPTLIVGGNSVAGLRRAARVGDGWYGYRVSADDAATAVSQLREFRDQEHRRGDFEITVTPAGALDSNQIEAYEKAGVHRLVIVAEGHDLDEVEGVVRANSPDVWLQRTAV